MSTATTIKKFILDSPPGEFGEVLDDVRSIVDQVDMKLLYGLARQRNIQSCSVVEIIEPKTGEPVNSLLSQHNQLSLDEEGTDEDIFTDPVVGVQFKVDHFSMKTTNQLSHEPTFADQNIAEYIERSFPTGVWRLFTVNPSKVVLVIVANRFRPENFWTGQWRAEWSWNPQDGSGLRGSIKIGVHYFEDGNIQLRMRTTIAPPEVTCDPENITKCIVQTIERMDGRVQASLNKAYVRLGEQTFKRLRRQLPITRTKVDWTKLAGYRLGEEIVIKNKSQE